MPRSRKVRFAAVALLALLGFATNLADQSFFHTDDGCVVELHCLACRSASVVAGPVVAAAPAVVAPATFEAVTFAQPAAPRTPARAAVPNRGPPAA